MFEISVRGKFSAAHFVRGYKGDCASGHGHTYRVEVTVIKKKLDKIGFAYDFKKLEKRLNTILKELDHTNLNQLPFFRKRNPTAEWLGLYIFKKLKKIIGDVALKSVTIWEGDDNKAVYTP